MSGCLYSLAWDASGTVIAAGSSEGRLYLVDAVKHIVKARLQVSNKPVRGREGGTRMDPLPLPPFPCNESRGEPRG